MYKTFLTVSAAMLSGTTRLPGNTTPLCYSVLPNGVEDIC